jgi:phosphopantothenoylcysteine decarboxylase/phosphopantothenate--cysteine ligase
MGSLKNKKILITAGPTWIPLDDVRVISNVSSGALGLLLAKTAEDAGARVDLFLGPVGPIDYLGRARISSFKYFNDFFRLVSRELKKTKYDIILHCAAVSDYVVKRTPGKMVSKKKKLILNLKQAPKIIDKIRRLNPKAFLVMFKLESGISSCLLKKRASNAMKAHGADLVVANMFGPRGYLGFVMDKKNILAASYSRAEMAKKLIRCLEKRVGL